ncbi:MAG: hypothetical protein IID09_04565 [Candidatus Hydrogenedentes bacterium]|nr:hypothetical protein [Candidatus Hydrogenedentota bacterium]
MRYHPFNPHRFERIPTLRGAHRPAGFRPSSAIYPLVMLALSAVLYGCAGLGQRVDFASLPEGAPAVTDILRDLAANDDRISNFRGAGTFTIESPEFDAVKKFRGSIKFQRPADLFVQGNHRITNIPLFKLTCVGAEFLMEFPGSQDQSFYQLEGERYDDVPFSVSPSDIVREMFLPEEWDEIGRKDARVIAFDPEKNIATLSIGPSAAPRRWIEVARIDPENPTWVVVRNVRLDETGRVIAETRLAGYNAIGTAMFPTEIDAWFPTEATRMTFKMRNIRLNTDLPPDTFDLRTRALELQLAEIRPGDKEGKVVPLTRRAH